MERARTTCLVGLAGLLVGGFAAAALLLFAWSSMAEQSTADMTATPMATMPTDVPLPTTIPTAQVRIETAVSGPAVAQGMRAQARLETIEVPLTVPVTGTVSAGTFERLVGVQNRDSIVFMAYGVATAGVDLAQIKDQDVGVLEDGTIVLTVTTTLFHVRMDNQASKIVDRDRAVTCSRVIYNVIEIFHKLHAPTTCARVRNGGMLYLIDRRCVALQQQKKPL